jgi:hypothetical protein
MIDSGRFKGKDELDHLDRVTRARTTRGPAGRSSKNGGKARAPRRSAKG